MFFFLRVNGEYGIGFLCCVYEIRLAAFSVGPPIIGPVILGMDAGMDIILMAEKEKRTARPQAQGWSFNIQKVEEDV